MATMEEMYTGKLLTEVLSDLASHFGQIRQEAMLTKVIHTISSLPYVVSEGRLRGHWHPAKSRGGLSQIFAGIFQPSSGIA
jgi:hypothetical protein